MVAALTPLLVLPIAALTVIHGVDGVPDFMKGLVTGVSIALLLGYCFSMGTLIGAQKRRADARRLDALDPLGGLGGLRRDEHRGEDDSEGGAR
jgi:hypothetical protein